MFSFQQCAAGRGDNHKIFFQFMTKEYRSISSCKFCVSGYSRSLVITANRGYIFDRHYWHFLAGFADFSSTGCGVEYKFSTTTSRSASGPNLVALDFIVLRL